MNKKAKKRFKIISDYSIKSDKTRLAKVCPRVEKTAATSQIWLGKWQILDIKNLKKKEIITWKT